MINNIEHDKNSIASSFFSMISNHETHARGRINLIASENSLSPLAKLPYLMDVQARYFLDDFRRFGKWYFPSGIQIGEIEHNILIPLLQELSEAAFVNVRPISGMNCMLIALAAFTQPGDTIFTIPIANGGHVSTAVITKRLSLNRKEIPFLNAFDIDYVAFEKQIAKTRPSLVYIDQSTFLFPIDPQPIRHIIDKVSPETIIHYDSSHINGLIFGKALFNPLAQGAHCYGGSTHKTLPGPHKGFLATNDSNLAKRIDEQANHFVSHHHTGSTLSLIMALLEMKWCSGDEYANQVIVNTRAFAAALDKKGFIVAAKDRNYTECHQTWMSLPHGDNQLFYEVLTQAGIMVSQFDELPGIFQPAFRLSFAELTRMGATIDDAQLLADIMFALYENPQALLSLKTKIKALRESLSTTKFCFQLEDLNQDSLSDDFGKLCKTLLQYDIGE